MKKIMFYISTAVCILTTDALGQINPPDFRQMQQQANANFYTIVNTLDSLYKLIPDSSGDGGKMGYLRWKAYYKDRVNFGKDSLNGSFYWMNKFAQQSLYTPPCIVQGTHSSNWQADGPDYVQTQQCGIITAVAATSGLDTIFTAGRGTGLYRSFDFGRTWTNVTDYLMLPNLGINDIAIDPKNSNIIYIATQNNNSYGYGLMKSIDGGNTWQATALTYTPNQMISTRKILIHPLYNNVVYVMGNNAIYKSWNGGDNFAIVHNDVHYTHLTKQVGIWVDRSYNDIALDYADSAVLYIGTTGVHGYLINGNNTNEWIVGDALMLKVTSNNGFTAVQLPIPVNDSIDKVTILTTPAAPNRVLRFLYTKKVMNSVITRTERSYNKGLNWHLKTNAPPSDFDYHKNTFCISKIDSNIIYAGGIHFIKKSTDGGASYNLIPSNSLIHVDQRTSYFVGGNIGGTNDTILWGNDGGLVVSTNGFTTWEEISKPLQLTEFHAFDILQNTQEIIAGGVQDIGYKTKKIDTWKVIVGVGDGYQTAFLKRNPNFVYGYGGGFSSHFYESQNFGGTFATKTPVNGYGKYITAPLFIDKWDNLLTASHSLYKCTPPSLTWSLIHNFDAYYLTQRLDSSKQISYVAIAPSQPAVIYLSFDGGSGPWNIFMGPKAEGRKNVLFRSENSGQTFIDLTNNISETEADNVTDIVVDQYDHQKLWVTFSGFDNPNMHHVYMSADGGNTFTDYSQGLPEFPVNCMIQQYNTNKTALYVGTDVGVFYRDNTMSAWECFNNNMPRTNVTQLKINYCNQTLYAATYGRGLWTSNLAIPSTAPVLPTTPVIAGDTVLCTAPTHTYTVTNAQSGLYYTWAASNNTNGTGTTATLTTFNAYQPGWITFTAVDTNVAYGCNSASSTFELIACCGATAGRDWSNDAVSSIKIKSNNGQQGYTYFTAPNIFDGNGIDNFAVNGVFDVDQNIILTDCNVTLGPNAKIIVRAGKSLTLDNHTHLHTCFSQFMWQGIVLEDDARLYVKGGSTVEESKIGVETFGIARVVCLDSTYFYRNHIHIKMNPCTTNNASVFKQTMFDCADNNGSVTSLIAPYKGDYTLACIQADDVLLLNIGDTTNIAYTNRFANAYYGILAKNTRVKVYNNRFKNITDFNWNPNQSINAHAIHLTGDNTNRLIEIGCWNKFLPTNYFDSCLNGVYTNTKIGGYVRNNYFTQIKNKAISVNQPGFNGINIINNYLRGFYTGITVTEFGTGGKTIIQSNNCKSLLNYSQQGSYHNTAIYTANFASQGLEKLEIRSNIIDSSRIGIYVLNAYKPRIMGNKVNFREDWYNLLPGTHHAIYLGNCTKDSVAFNTVHNFGSSTGAPATFKTDMRGFTFNNCNTNYVYANYQAASGIDNMGTAIYFYGANTTTHLKCNKWVSCKQGIYEDGTTLGYQGAANDTWENEWNAFGTNYRVDGVNAALVWWYFKGLIPNNKYSPDPFINVPITMAPNSTQPNVDYCSEPAIEGNDSIHIAAVVNGTVTYPEFTASNGYSDSLSALQSLYNDSALRYSNSDFLNFYNAEMNNTMGDFIVVFNSIFAEDYTTAQTKLLGINCENQIEVNLKEVLTIFTNAKINNVDFSTEEIEALQNIAYQIPKEGGIGVYLARAILNEEIDDANGTGRHSFAKSEHDNIAVEVFPNPNNGEFTIYFRSEKSIVLHLTMQNPFGDQLVESKIENNQKLTLKNLSNGVYFINFFANNILVSTKKIVVIK